MVQTLIFIILYCVRVYRVYETEGHVDFAQTDYRKGSQMAALSALPSAGGHGGGQITMFTVSSCRHCARAKQYLSEVKHWPYYEISLDAYPGAKTAMLQLSDRLTVPQIFFNETHVGGSCDLKTMDEDGTLDDLYENMRGSNPPADPRFYRPRGVSPVVPKRAPELTETDLCIGGLYTSYAEVYATITGARDGNSTVYNSSCSNNNSSNGSTRQLSAVMDIVGAGDDSSSSLFSGSIKAGETGAVRADCAPVHTFVNSNFVTHNSNAPRDIGSTLGFRGSDCHERHFGNPPNNHSDVSSNTTSSGSSISTSSSGTDDCSHCISSRGASGSDSELDTRTSCDGQKCAASQKETHLFASKIPPSSSSSSSAFLDPASNTDSATNSDENDSDSSGTTVKGSMVLDIRDRKYYLQTYRRCFLGSQLVDVLLDRYDLRGGREEARQVAEMLFDSRMFRHVTNEHGFEDSSKLYYRMTADEEPLVLNTWRVWNDRVEDDSLAMLTRCSTVLDRILERHRNEEGLVAYDAAAEDDEFPHFEEMTCEIQAIDLAKLEPDSRLVFVLNLYNMMVKHAFAKVGRPETTLKRDAFFSNVSYNIGGLVYSLNDLENGVLRGNKRPPGFHLTKPFGAGDPRLNSVLAKLDPRIHFALNCGAKSCPPVKKYTAPNVQEELRVVALAFCEQDSNVHVDMESKTLSTSRIFYWYANDFGGSTEEVLERIMCWLRGERKAQWDKVLKSGKYRHRKLNYDWTTDALSSGKTFQGVPRGK